MSKEIVINQIGISNQEIKPQIHLQTPMYLIELELEILEGYNKFLAIRYDDNGHALSAVGFYTTKDIKEIRKSFKEIVASTDKSCYNEVKLPWHNILSITNLSFKKN